MTTEDYLQGKFEYVFSTLNFQSTLFGRGIVAGISFTEVSERNLDLAQSDLYMILANVTSGSGKRISKGNRSVTDKSISFGITDRQNFRNEAIRLRSKWGESSDLLSNVQFVNMFEQ